MNITKTYSAEDMNAVLSAMVSPDESVVAAVYCAFTIVGAASQTYANGYVAMTDKRRMIGVKYGLFSKEQFSFSGADLSKIRLHAAIMGYSADLIFKPDGGKKARLCFTVARKVAGKGFPEQETNAERLREELEALEHENMTR